MCNRTLATPDAESHVEATFDAIQRTPTPLSHPRTSEEARQASRLETPVPTPVPLWDEQRGQSNVSRRDSGAVGR